MMWAHIHGPIAGTAIAALALSGCQHAEKAKTLETPQEIAAILAKDSPEVTRILRDNPGIVEAWRDEWWPDALLRGQPLPGSKWRSHDMRRPQPPLGAQGFTDCPAQAAPDDAVALLDTASDPAFKGEGLDSWNIGAGTLQASGGLANRIASTHAFGDIELHLEFKTPVNEPPGQFQARGNSGVFLMGLYEVQILDSYENPVYPDGALGALYGQHPPLVNAALPPGHWQCMDIAFTAPQFDGATLVSPARATVIVNGILVQDNTAFFGPTGFGGYQPYTPHPAALPLALQDHGDATSRVTFRNIWVRRKESTNE